MSNRPSNDDKEPPTRVLSRAWRDQTAIGACANLAAAAALLLLTGMRHGEPDSPSFETRRRRCSVLVVPGHGQDWAAAKAYRRG